jgi:hypothetical protein
LIGGEIEEHQSICGFEPVVCNNNCGMKVTRNRIQAHLSTVCTKRQVGYRHTIVLTKRQKGYSHSVILSAARDKYRIQAHLTTVCTKRQVGYGHI